MRNTFRYSFATILTAGLVTAPLTAVFADTTDGSGGVGSGNQVIVPADIEADLCGNSLAILGISSAECTQVSEVLYETSGHAETDGSGGVASGNQIIIPVDAAVDACGNAVAVGGISEAECVEVVETLEEEAGDAPGTLAETDGSGGVASGNQIIVPVDAAVDICGNSVALLGSSTAKCTTVINIIHAAPENEGDVTTDGSGGVASGNQIVVPVDAAVDICGNAVSVLGMAEAGCMEIISDGGEGEQDDGKEEDDNGKGDEDEGEQDDGKEEDDNGKGDEDEGEQDDGKEDDDNGKGDEGDDKPAPSADGELPVTGGALSGLVAAAVAAIGAGGAGLYFTRKRKAAATAAADDE